MKNRKIIKITVITFTVILLLVIIAAFTATRILLNNMFGRADHSQEDLDVYQTIDLKRRDVSFKSRENTLNGFVWGEDFDKLVIISHGLGGYSGGYYAEMEFFARHGYGVLTYDNTGTGRSEGKGTMGMSQSVIDLHNALTFTEQDNQLKDMPVYLFGHSWGGHAVCAVLNYNHKNVKAAASVAGYNSNGGIVLEWMKGQMNLGGFAYLVYPFTAFWTSIDAHGAFGYTAVKGINSCSVPVLAVQGSNDEIFWQDSIYNHRDEITNNNFEYFLIENGTHNGILKADNIEDEYKAVNKITISRIYNFFESK